MVMIIRQDADFEFRIAKAEFLIDTTDAVDGHLLDLYFFSPENVIFFVILLALFHILFFLFHPFDNPLIIRN